VFCSCDVKELSSSQNSERSKFKSKNIIERRLIY
jgi:SUMO ligase MMS21 Smc5/6 complex component